jgi:hypothetical protein
LAHGELHDHHRDGEDERRKTDHRCSNGAKYFHRGVWTAAEPFRNGLVVECSIDGDRYE